MLFQFTAIIFQNVPGIFSQFSEQFQWNCGEKMIKLSIDKNYSVFCKLFVWSSCAWWKQFQEWALAQCHKSIFLFNLISHICHIRHIRIYLFIIYMFRNTHEFYSYLCFDIFPVFSIFQFFCCMILDKCLKWNNKLKIMTDVDFRNINFGIIFFQMSNAVDTRYKNNFIN